MARWGSTSAAVIGNLLLAFFSQEGHESSPGIRKGYRNWLLQTVEETWNRFEQRFLELWQEQAFGRRLSRQPIRRSLLLRSGWQLKREIIYNGSFMIPSALPA